MTQHRSTLIDEIKNVKSKLRSKDLDLINLRCSTIVFHELLTRHHSSSETGRYILDMDRLDFLPDGELGVIINHLGLDDEKILKLCKDFQEIGVDINKCYGKDFEVVSRSPKMELYRKII